MKTISVPPDESWGYHAFVIVIPAAKVAAAITTAAQISGVLYTPEIFLLFQVICTLYQSQDSNLFWALCYSICCHQGANFVILVCTLQSFQPIFFIFTPNMILIRPNSDLILSLIGYISDHQWVNFIFPYIHSTGQNFCRSSSNSHKIFTGPRSRL